MTPAERTLAERLGMTRHVSPLRRRVERLALQWPAPDARCVEDWLVEVANARGARIVVRPGGPAPGFRPPDPGVLSNEELVVALCQPNCLDRPQILRLAAQLISRGAIYPAALRLTAARERAEPVLAELARQALKVDPQHAIWREIARNCRSSRPLREPILHWTRLAEPVMKNGRCNAASWRLVA